MLKLILLLSLALFSANAAQGIDINTGEGPYSQDVWECVKSKGNDFAILQIWRGGHKLSDHWITDYQNAKAAGIEYIDAYIFACNNCNGNTPDEVCQSVAEALPTNFDGMVWLDIEICDNCFVGTSAQKLDYFQDVVKSCTQRGLKMGVYSFYGGWWDMFGSTTYTSGTLTSLPLWYAHYNNDLTFNDFPAYKFGNWQKPAMKQWQADATVCGILCDLNVY